MPKVLNLIENLPMCLYDTHVTSQEPVRYFSGINKDNRFLSNFSGNRFFENDMAVTLALAVSTAEHLDAIDAEELFHNTIVKLDISGTTYIDQTVDTFDIVNLDKSNEPYIDNTEFYRFADIISGKIADPRAAIELAVKLTNGTHRAIRVFEKALLIKSPIELFCSSKIADKKLRVMLIGIDRREISRSII